MSTAASHTEPNDSATVRRLESLSPGQLVPFGGDRVAIVDHALASAFQAGDRLVVVHETGDLLHLPLAEHELAASAVEAAAVAFAQLGEVADDRITAFFAAFADLLADDARFAEIASANAADVDRARRRGRSTTRLELSDSMRQGMIDGLGVWRDVIGTRDAVLSTTDHGSWKVETRRAPLGVVGFVFEGRPNVFADATGVLRTGNTVVFRIGSDALGTAAAIMRVAVRPALAGAGLPEGSVQLIESEAHAAGWALFSDARLGLAVARGSGRAVAQLGAVARQHGVPVSLHGTGGAWLVVDRDADAEAIQGAVLHSLDRKVCNTLNVCCVVASGADRHLPVVLAAAREAASRRNAALVLHATPSAQPLLEALGATASALGDHQLGTEWEWENDPELSVVVVDSIDEAVALFNRFSPRFTASLVSSNTDQHERFYASVDAPFVGNGFTRWVDGQFAFDQPELGLSNWQSGRLFARGGVLSGDSVYTVRTRATVRNHDLHR
jgi:glutamate-5-semialdehyde dehydrogenase